MSFHRIVESESVTSNEPHPDSFISINRKHIRFVIIKCRIGFLIFFRKCNPCLYHFKLTSGEYGWIFESFGMCNAFAGSHPVHFSGLDHLLNSKTVTMCYLSSKEIAHSRETDMRMWQN